MIEIIDNTSMDDKVGELQGKLEKVAELSTKRNVTDMDSLMEILKGMMSGMDTLSEIISMKLSKTPEEK